MTLIKNAILWIGVTFLVINGLAIGRYLMYAYWTLAEVLVNYP